MRYKMLHDSVPLTTNQPPRVLTNRQRECYVFSMSSPMHIHLSIIIELSCTGQMAEINSDMTISSRPTNQLRQWCMLYSIIFYENLSTFTNFVMELRPNGRNSSLLRSRTIELIITQMKPQKISKKLN